MAITRLFGYLALAAAAACASDATAPVTGPPAQLAILRQPSHTVANEAMTPGLQVVVLDSNGFLVDTSSATVTVLITPGAGTAGATLVGPTTVGANHGVATFVGLFIDSAGTYSLSASAPGLGVVTTPSFTMASEPATRLRFAVDTIRGVAGQPFARIVVRAIDDFGNLDTADHHAVTLTLSPGATGATLAGTTTTTMSGGIAQFENLVVDKPDSSFSLAASAPGLRSAHAVMRAAPVVTGAAMGMDGLCATTVTGIAWCFGNTRLTSQRADSSFTGFPLFASVIPGFGTWCGLTAQHNAWCWGELTGTGSGSTTPVQIPGRTFVALAISWQGACGIDPGGSAWCWGRNSLLGNGSTSGSSVPVPVAGGLHFSSISAGSSSICGVTTGGAGYCWGNNYSGEVGSGTGDTLASTPEPVAGGLAFSLISSGEGHACGLLVDGTAYCWGNNYSSQLGNGNTTSSPVPVAVLGGHHFKSISAGSAATCAIDVAGAAWCWGYNKHGALGTDGGTAAVPVPVQGGRSYASVASNGESSCAVATTGELYCWGAAAPRMGVTNWWYPHLVRFY